MGSQDLINSVISIVVAVVGYVIKELWGSIKELSNKYNTLNNQVVSSYVHKDDFNRMMETVFNKLDRNQDVVVDKLDQVYNKLDRKVDKDDCESCGPGRWQGKERRS